MKRRRKTRDRKSKRVVLKLLIDYEAGLDQLECIFPESGTVKVPKGEGWALFFMCCNPDSGFKPLLHLRSQVYEKPTLLFNRILEIYLYHICSVSILSRHCINGQLSKSCEPQHDKTNIGM